ncbi:HTH_Tnp_Tc3_2 domain-containing protein [Trichonephila clavipes]|nr:HTH_Tnp_Tc3_2 domain-containing protein [Trichonephila clavipes]
MASLGHQSLPPTNLGRVDEEMVLPEHSCEMFHPQRNALIFLYVNAGLGEGGFSFRDIAERLSWTVQDYCEQWSRNGAASRRPGSGCPRGSTERKVRLIRRTAIALHTECVAEIPASVGTTVTQRTVRNQLHQGQLRARHHVACISLTPSHCHLRRQWCQARAH